ncbi:transposase [Streptomyces sp. ActVer]|uniref:transposase n=1 Tax=Streptomyces sp. ActVer TaxID=3014558 RepID=UPI0022B34237|nr:transposase [Streptomyces sp. ActVer]MCZ4516106.1 transposase [Streptomyces sp. ActVer]
MPADFPPWPRVYAFFARWRDTGLVTELHERLREAVRRSQGRAPQPSAAVVDSQSVKAEATIALYSRGFDAGKKTNGRKRHLLTDTLGLLLTVLVTPASTTDRDGARTLLPTATGRFRRLSRSGPTAATPVRQLALVMDRWWPEIEVFVHTRINNATSEGINRVIKFAGRAAYGFRNPTNQRPEHAASPPAEPPDTSAPHNFEDAVY